MRNLLLVRTGNSADFSRFRSTFFRSASFVACRCHHFFWINRVGPFVCRHSVGIVFFSKSLSANSYPWEEGAVLHRPSIRGRQADPRYLGAGTIGNVWDAGEKSGRYRLLQCETVDIVRFPAPVPLKDADGEYLESDANRTQHVGLYFSQGVRTISVHDYKRILRACVDLDPVDEPNWQG